MMLADNRRAVAAGLTFRPLTDTIRATLTWDRCEGARGNDAPIRVIPIAPEREIELLAAHRSEHASVPEDSKGLTHRAVRRQTRQDLE
jgi:hypothetical protein